MRKVKSFARQNFDFGQTGFDRSATAKHFFGDMTGLSLAVDTFAPFFDVAKNTREPTDAGRPVCTAERGVYPLRADSLLALRSGGHRLLPALLRHIHRPDRGLVPSRG